MAAISFKTTDIPETSTGRVKSPNPYLPHAQAAVKARGDRNDAGEYPGAKAITYTLREDEKVEYLTRKVREAGKEVSATIRVKNNGDGTVTLWATDPITRRVKKDAEA